MSYENLVLYGATIPSFDTDKKNKGSNKDKDEEIINLDNPEEWEKVRALYRH